MEHVFCIFRYKWNDGIFLKVHRFNKIWLERDLPEYVSLECILANADIVEFRISFKVYAKAHFEKILFFFLNIQILQKNGPWYNSGPSLYWILRNWNI